MDAVDIKVPDSLILDGYSILPSLKNNNVRQRNEMFWELRGDYAARVGNWKWVFSSKGNGLFNLDKDIREQNDLSASKPEILEMIRKKFAEWQVKMSNALPRGPFKDY